MPGRERDWRDTRTCHRDRPAAPGSTWPGTIAPAGSRVPTLLHGAQPKHAARSGAGHRDAHRRAGFRDEHRGDGVARGRAAKFRITGAVGNGKFDARDDLAAARAPSRTAKRNRRPAAMRRRSVTTVAPRPEHRRRIVGGGIIVGDRCRRWCRGGAHAGRRSSRPVRPARELIGGPAGDAATSACKVVAPIETTLSFATDAAQRGKDAEIDEVGRMREPLFQRRKQRVSAGQIGRILARREEADAPRRGRRAVVAGRIHHHPATPRPPWSASWLRRQTGWP